VISATIAVHHEFFMYRNGVYRASSPNLHVEGYHSVRLLGWGEEPMPNGPPVKYWVKTIIYIKKLLNLQGYKELEKAEK